MPRKLFRFKRDETDKLIEIDEILKKIEFLSDTELKLLKINDESRLELLKLSNLPLVIITMIVTMVIAAINMTSGKSTVVFWFVACLYFFVFFVTISSVLSKFLLFTSTSVRNTARQLKAIDYELERRKNLKESQEKIIQYRQKVLNQKYGK